ncbi:MAG: secretion protein HlyD [Betaproteobacteria bacterium RIFCSPLOWO2_02_FULL_65_24]|nr:MAG: secretion protein HlyD [Betaproteobacteria bacterium RIFCSPLOWO2_02_FULL_65_24]OGA36297.1 MAG: secretion protein HlyD [Betaproteobacteria bacterium RIFCSPLOWO2_12_FULL_62_13b]
MNARSVLVLGLFAALAACSATENGSIQGYVEGEFVMLAAPSGGLLDSLRVSRGQQVEAGAPLFSLDRAAELAARMEAAERLRNTQARLANLRAGRRGPEVEALAAQTEQAKAARELSSIQLRQQEKLFAAGFISRAQLDAARANFERDTARVEEIQAQARLAKLSIGRDAEIQASTAEVEAARAALAQAEWRLSQRSIAAPAAALVHDTYFQPGEWVPAGRPVASLLPAANVKVRFFVPQALLGSIKPGDAVRVACDGCPSVVEATIRFISRQAEFTPPVLYSKESRNKLVFMVEAQPALDQAGVLKPGQPVDVTMPDAAIAR